MAYECIPVILGTKAHSRDFSQVSERMYFPETHGSQEHMAP